jgi:DNA repair exonuclease SbcCD ATPase subunit
MDGASLDELREELATLEATEKQISAERRRLHNQIDYGFSNAATLAREREVSDERRRLHRRIDALRELLPEQGDVAGEAPDSPLSALGQWSGITPELVAIDDASADDEPVL